jgi:hypothetical protein
MPEEELPPTPPTPPPTVTTWSEIDQAQVTAQNDWEALMVSPMGTPYRVPKSLFGFATSEGVAQAQQDASNALQAATAAGQTASAADQTAQAADQTAQAASQAASTAAQAADTANQWIASPLSTQQGNQATLDGGKIFVAPPSQAVSTLGTVSSPVTVSSTTAETILASFPIAGGTLAPGDILDLLWAIRKGPAGHTGTVKVYLNTSNAIGGTTLHNVANGFSSNTMFMYSQKYVVTSAGLVIPNPLNASGGTNLTNFQTQSGMGAPASFNPATNYWLIVTSTQSSGSSLEILEFAKLFKLR